MAMSLGEEVIGGAAGFAPKLSVVNDSHPIVTSNMACADDINFIANGNPLIKLDEEPEEIDDDQDEGRTMAALTVHPLVGFPGSNGIISK